ncbi:endonuclease domain-containing protein [Corynebacterium phocae]|uniref:endonuclease domain-containing protein n=1 Tax=Corynebacterium phocae TaxID=161895 RepID=UPI0014712F5D|nr:DUF559 domain-containing protein [Corynebacterium phocae]
MDQSETRKAVRRGQVIKLTRGIYARSVDDPGALAEALCARQDNIHLTGASSFRVANGMNLEFPLEFAGPSCMGASEYWRFYRVRKPFYFDMGKLRVLHPLQAVAHEPDFQRARAMIEYHYGGPRGNDQLNQDLQHIKRLSNRSKAILAAAVIGTDSAAERKVIARLRRHGLVVESNVLIGDYRWDIVIRSLNVAVEIDGHKYHSQRDVFIKDHWKRNDAIMRGWTVLTYTGSCVEHAPDEVVAQILESRNPDLSARRYKGVQKWHGYFNR